MWTRLYQSFFRNSEFFQQCRTTYVVKRVTKAPLASATRVPSLRKRHFVYETVQTNEPHPETLTVLLEKYVEDIGKPGDVVTVKDKQARFLILTKAAAYISEERIGQPGNLRAEDTFSSLYAATTVHLLSKFVLNISMNRDEPWTLEPWHIRSAFRKAHVHVPDGTFTFPKDAIIGPDMELEGKEFYVTVTINNKEQVPVRCRIHHWSTKPDQRLSRVRDHWKFPVATIFPEDKVVAETLPEMIPPILLDDEGPPHLRRKESTKPRFKKKRR